VLAAWVAPVAAASSRSGPDQAPGEIALLAVFLAVIVAAAAVVIRRARVRSWQPAARLREIQQRLARAGAEPGAVDRGGPDPEPPGGADSPRWRPRPAVLLAAVAVVVLLVGVSTAVYLLGSGHATTSRGRTAAAAGAYPGAPLAPGAPAASPTPGKQRAKDASGSPGPGQSPGHGGAAASGSGSPSSGSSPRPTSPVTSTTSPTSGSTSPPPAPTLVLPAQPVEFEPIESLSGPYYYFAIFTITAENGTVSYTITAPADAPSAVSIDPASGTLSAGQSATITIDTGASPVSSVTVDPGAETITFTWERGHIN
jgi:hypothetical protein